MKNGVNSTEECCQSAGDASVVLRRSVDEVPPKIDGLTYIDKVKNSQINPDMIKDNITNAIVPIYCNDEFWGTGVIYDTYLITAAHVVKDYKNIFYQYRGNRHSLNICNRIHFELRGNERNEQGIIPFDPDAEDLTIYKIGTPCHKVVMCVGDIQDGTDAVLFGYHYENENKISLKSGMVRVYNELELGLVSFWPQSYCQYCKQIDDTLHIIKGYSGGPLLVGNTVVGILIESMTIDGYYHIMKSKRIWDIINNNEHDTD